MDSQSQQLARVKYPHMVPEEVRIWKRFLKRYATRFTGFRYDVHVGEGVGRQPGLPTKYQNMAIRLSQKRIDVVGFRGALTYIIEIKDRAGMSAIGQLVAYKKLYENKYGKGKVTGLIIVATSADEDLKRVIPELRIQLILV